MHLAVGIPVLLAALALVYNANFLGLLRIMAVVRLLFIMELTSGLHGHINMLKTVVWNLWLDIVIPGQDARCWPMIGTSTMSTW